MNRLSLSLVAVSIGAVIVPLALLADNLSVTFEQPTYILGSIDAQDGWSSKGSIGAGCAVYDHAVSNNTYGYSAFAARSLRISNAVTSGCFGDQTFSKSLANDAGELTATNGGYSGGARQPHFDASFDIASTVPGSQQPGLLMSVSPDRGDGARMSYVRFEDGNNGLDVFFVEVIGTRNPANFKETRIANGLDRSVPHRIRFSIDFVEGPSNDVVRVYIDNAVAIVGTTWENYFRFDPESVEGGTRTVDSLLFRTSGAAVPANLGNGFLLDNVSLSSGPTATTPAAKADCFGTGWKLFSSPVFATQGDCVAFVGKL